MNPEKDKFVFDPDIEKYMQSLADHGVRPSFKINGPPRWNDTSTVSGKEGEPKDYALYEKTLEEYARHYMKFGLDRYYIINEPDQGGWWTGGWPGYYRFLASSDKAIKSVDKRLLTVAPESWSFVAQFVDTVLKSEHVDVFSGHYPLENSVGNVHGDFYWTRMFKTGVTLPFINGEEFASWPSNLRLGKLQKNYPGALGDGAGVGPVAMANLGVGAYRTVELHLTGRRPNPQPFLRFGEHDVVPDQTIFQHRAVADELVGTQVRKQLETPPNVIAWLYKRGGDNFLGTYVPIPQMTQLMEITTSSQSLRIFDCFGNAQLAEPVNGKVRLLLSNMDVYVHGLGANDQFAFLPHVTNEKPQIVDPGEQVVAVGKQTALNLGGFGYDPDAQFLRKMLPEWSLKQAPEGMTIRPGSGVIEWSPKAIGRASVTVALTDSEGASAARTFAIDVTTPDGPLARFATRPAPAAVKNGLFKYRPKAVMPNGDALTYSVEGPEGMKMADGVITWTPAAVGDFVMKVTATEPKGRQSVAAYALPVVPNPDRPAEGVMAPRNPTDLTVTKSGPAGVTLVWNQHTFAEHLVQRSTSANGPWTQIAALKDENWFTDKSPGAAAYYRVIARNSGGESEPSEMVNGLNRAPIADAGASRKLAEPGKAELDARGSFDPEGKDVRYQWAIVGQPAESKATLENATSQQAALVTDVAGRYVLSLVVNDGQESSRPDYLWVLVGADRLDSVAYGGADRFATVGERMPLAPVAFSPVSTQRKWFWRWDQSPLNGYVGIRDFMTSGGDITKQKPSLTPQVPGVYQIFFYPIDGETYGYPDVVRIIVGPGEVTGN